MPEKTIQDTLSFFDNLNESQKKELLSKAVSTFDAKKWLLMTQDEQCDTLLEMFQRSMPWAGSKPKFDLEFLVKIYRSVADVTFDDMLKVKNNCEEYFNTPGNEKEIKRYTNFRSHFQFRVERYMSNKRFYNLKQNKVSAKKDAGVMLRCPNCGLIFRSTFSLNCALCKVKGVEV